MKSPIPTPAVIVVSAYRFHMFELARQLERLGALERLVTAMPPSVVAEVSPDRLNSRARVAVIRHAASRLSRKTNARLNRMVIADFDRWASRQVERGDVIVGLSSYCTRTLERAAASGRPTVCDRGSWHILEQRQVLDKEAERWGWPRVPFDPWIVERELTDYEVADRIFVPSEQARQSFVRQGIVPAKLATVRYGVDVARYVPSPGRDPLRVISVAHIGLRKGHPYLLPAYRAVRRRGSTLVLVGEATREAVERLTVKDEDVVITGTVSRARVAEELRRSGIFVLASVEEGLALVVAQAMACGLPVIATTATGASELITHGDEGFIVPAGDEQALASALDRLLTDPDRAQSMGNAARDRVLSAGGWDAYGQSALAELKTVIGHEIQDV